jgi:hypothetical protein
VHYRALTFVTILLAALSLTMESAHVLEMPPNMQMDLTFYTAVNGTLYRYFAIVGGVYQVGSVLASALLAWRLRRCGAARFRWTLAGALLLAAAFVVWGLVVAPVNQIVAAANDRAPATLPAVWSELRPRWEWGHAAGFAIQLAGFSALVAGLLAPVSKRF